MKKVFLLLLVALAAGCIPGRVVEKETTASAPPDSSGQIEEELEPPEEAGEQPPLPADLDPQIEVSEESAAPSDPLRRERYVVQGDSSILVGEGDPRVSRIWNVYGYSDSLEFWGKKGVRRTSERKGRDEMRLIGDAKIIDRGSTITGKIGIYNMNTRMAEMRDSVEILDGDAVIHCDYVRWDRNRRRSLLIGDVSIDYGGKVVLADTVHYDQRRRRATAFGRVRVLDPDSNMRIEGRHGSFDLDEEITIIDREPILWRWEDGDSSRTTAREMRHFRAESLMVAVGQVHYRSDELEAFGDSALFYQSRDRMDLFQEPRLQWDLSTLRGDTLRLYLEGQDPVYMDVIGAAVYEEANPDSLILGGRHTRIDGSHFGIFFEGGDISEVRVRGPANSVFTPELVPGDAAQVHEASGDSMVFTFLDDELDEVCIRGAAEGRSWTLENWEEHRAAADSAAADSAGFGPGLPLPYEELARSYIYRADSVLFQVPEELVDLVGKPAEVEESFQLSGDSIHLDSGDEYMIACGDPVFRDGEQELFGERMEYDLATGEGLVFSGEMALGSGYFTGPRMKKVGEKDINVSEAIYTTCEHIPPHSSFRMAKVRAENEKIYASPVVLHIGEVPIFTLPTFFLDLKRGRRSGVLVPNFEFGINADRQRFIRNFGYYWAMSDYTDLLLRGDFVEDSSILGSATFRYKRRYWRDGSFSGNWRYDRKHGLGENTSRSWGLMGSHSMTMGQYTRINSSVNFASSEDLREIDHYTVDQTINQRLTSNLNASTKLFDKLPFSTGFNMTQHLGKEDDNPETDNLIRQVSTPVSLSWPGLSLPVGLGMKLTLPSFKYTRTSKQYEEHQVVDEKIPLGTSLSRTFKVFSVSLRPSAGYSVGFSRTTEPLDETVFQPFGPAETPPGGSPGSPLDNTETLEETELEVIEGWKHTESMSAGLSANWKVYGLFYPRGSKGENLPFRLGPITAIRHSFAPSASFSYSDNRSRGVRSISRSVSMSLEQSLDFKTGQGEDEKKHNGIITWSLRSSLKPELWPDDDPWGRLSSSVRIRPGGGVSVSLTHAWDPNTWELQSSTINGTFAKSFTVRIGSFLAREDVPAPAGEQRRHRAKPAGGAGGATGLPGGFTGGGPGTGFGASAPKGEPGDLSLETNFSMNRTQSGQLTPNLRLSSSFQLSENWSLAWSGDLELENGSFGTQRMSVVRDLHCWEFRFTRLIYQAEPQYYFVIYLREHPEVKQEFGNRAVGGQGGLY